MNPYPSQPDRLETTSFFQVTRKYFDLPTATSRFNFQRKIVIHYRKLIPSLLLATGLGAFLAGPSFADGGCGAMGGSGHHGEHHAKHMEAHHKMLHDALKLTAEQEPGWKKLIDSEQPKPSAAQPVDWSKLTAPQRAEKMLELSKVRQEQMGEHVVALKAFYATLTPVQQKTFEDFHMSPRNGMRSKSDPASPKVEKAPVASKP
jgi:Spy/CpxP family protein refolding chaperone